MHARVKGLALARGGTRLFAAAFILREDGFGLRGGDAVEASPEVGAVAQVAGGNSGRLRLGRMAVHIRCGLAVMRARMRIRRGLTVIRTGMHIRRGLAVVRARMRVRRRLAVARGLMRIRLWLG